MPPSAGAKVRRIALALQVAAIFSLASTASAWTGPTATAPGNNASAPINVSATAQVKNGNIGVNGLAVFGNTLLGGATSSNAYLNFGGNAGTAGYGIWDNSGTLNFKNIGGTWQPLQTIITTLIGSSTGDTGSGSTNYITKFTGATTLGNSIISQSGAAASVAGSLTASTGLVGTASGAGWGVQGSGGTNGVYGSGTTYEGAAAGTSAVGVDGVASAAGSWGVEGVGGPNGVYAQGTSVPLEADNNSSGITAYLSYSGYGLYTAYPILATALYDANNTGYYLDPSSGSNIYDIAANGQGNWAYTATGQYGMSANTSNVAVEGLSSGSWGGEFEGLYGVYGQGTSAGQGGEFYNNSSGCEEVFSTASYSESANCLIEAPEFLYTSDERLKKNIAPLSGSDALGKVLQLQGVTYDWKDVTMGRGEQVGFIAQDVKKVLPDLVHTDASTTLESVDYARLTPYLVESIKEQQGTIDSQQKQLDAQQAEIDLLKKEIAALLAAK